MNKIHFYSRRVVRSKKNLSFSPSLSRNDVTAFYKRCGDYTIEVSGITLWNIPRKHLKKILGIHWPKIDLYQNWRVEHHNTKTTSQLVRPPHDTPSRHRGPTNQAGAHWIQSISYLITTIQTNRYHLTDIIGATYVDASCVWRREVEEEG